MSMALNLQSDLWHWGFEKEFIAGNPPDMTQAQLREKGPGQGSTGNTNNRDWGYQ